MAQLVKLQDYISRYESDIYRYSNWFIQLKHKRWESVKRHFRKAQLEKNQQEEETITEWEEDWFPEEKRSFFSFFRKNRKKTEERRKRFEYPKKKPIYKRAETIDELRQLFLDEVLSFQLRWASSTRGEKSYIDGMYAKDKVLKFLLQQLPDNYFVFYQPIFRIKQAPIELDIILVTPTEVMCLTFLKSTAFSVFHGSSEKFWTELIGDVQKKVLSPILALNRMEKIVSSILRKNKLDFPVHRVVVSEHSFIEFINEPSDLSIIDKRMFKEWHKRLAHQPSPLKHIQLKVTKALLAQCKTVSITRFNKVEENE